MGEAGSEDDLLSAESRAWRTDLDGDFEEPQAEPLDKPRRRCTPYEFFLNVCGEHCQMKGVEKDFSALSSLCYEKWGQMSEMDKKRFVRMSESDQTRLDKEMVIFNEAKKIRSEEKKMEENKKTKEDQKAEKIKAVEKIVEKLKDAENRECRRKGKRQRKRTSTL